MAIRLITTYSKKLGLPGYSSHQFSVSVETELTTTADIPAESDRLYQLLQSNVDQQIQQTGFVPPGTYGMEMPDGNGTNNNGQGTNGNPANGSHPGVNGTNVANGTAVLNGSTSPLDGRWKCSDKQRDLILKLVNEHQLDKTQIEALAVERFGHGVRQLNKLEASGLIDELLANNGGNGGNTNSPSTRRNGSNSRVNGAAYTRYAATLPGEDFAEVFHFFLRHRGCMPTRMAKRPPLVAKWRFIEWLASRISGRNPLPRRVRIS
jgi:hypothetical protein